MSALLRRALRRAQAQIRYVRPVRPRVAQGLVAAVYRQVEADFGMLAPPISLHSPAPEVMAASWTMLRESLLADGLVGRGSKEALATAVSEANSCPYCVDVHGATQAQVGGPAIPAAIADWVRGNGQPPFPGDETAEHVGVAVTFEYLNRMVNIFLPAGPFPPSMPVAARAAASRMLGRVASPGAGGIAAGGSVDLLPAAELPDDLSWAAHHATIAAAFARAGAAVDAGGHRSVPPAVRELVRTHLDGDRPSGPSRAWVDEAVAGLAEADRPAGRLALLTALASYQVDGKVVAAYRAVAVDDRALIELTAWSSLTAARHAGHRYAGVRP
jgi:AhpD family alkylhydroperoxidase